MKGHITTHFFAVLILALSTLQCQTNQNIFSPTDARLIESVDIDSLVYTIKELSGEVPVKIGNEYFTIESRYSRDIGNEIAEKYLYNKLLSYGYLTTVEQVHKRIKHVVGKKKGTKYPDQYIIFSAHYDSVPDRGKSPGADDNASGVATVLEAARLLKEIESDYSILFILWDEEERPRPMGSIYYADSLYNAKTQIKEMINVDMIGYDRNDDGIVMLYRPESENGINYFSIAEKINISLSLNLDFLFEEKQCASDDASFARYDYNSLTFIEHLGRSTSDVTNDFNPYWHTEDDTLDKFNLSYFHRCAKLTIAALLFTIRDKAE